MKRGEEKLKRLHIKQQKTTFRREIARINAQIRNPDQDFIVYSLIQRKGPEGQLRGTTAFRKN